MVIGACVCQRTTHHSVSKVAHLRCECTEPAFVYEVRLSESDQANCEAFKCTIYILSEHGTSMISDIDDTVQICHVLKHTSYSYFKPVDGMSEESRQCHHVSVSLWQLYVSSIGVRYPVLRSFLDKHRYPQGTDESAQVVVRLDIPPSCPFVSNRWNTKKSLNDLHRSKGNRNGCD